MADATVTRYEFSVDGYDETTGWPKPSYSSSSIDGSIQPRGASLLGLPVGGVAHYPQTFFTADVIARGDLIKSANNDYYVVTLVDDYWWMDQFSHYQCALDKRTPFAAPTTTSGTWHLDSDSLKTDPRYRHKLWLDTYLDSENIELDNGSTNASWIAMFAGIPYFCPLEQIFLTKDVDGIFSIDKRTVDNLVDYNHYPYAFIETVPITCYAVDKEGLTATNLLEQMVQEIRHVATDHPVTGSSLRDIDSTEFKSTDIGGTRLWETTVTVKYKHCNDDYEASYPTLTWGESGNPDGTYTFPNCTRIEWPNMSADIKMLPPGRVGNIQQIMGDTSLKVRLYFDLDVDASNKTWKRPQTTTPKTDQKGWQVLAEIKGEGGKIAGDEPYQVLTFGASGPSFKVRLVSFDIYEDSNGSTGVAEFDEYVSADASGDTYKTRWGIS